MFQDIPAEDSFYTRMNGINGYLDRCMATQKQRLRPCLSQPDKTNLYAFKTNLKCYLILHKSIQHVSGQLPV